MKLDCKRPLAHAVKLIAPSAPWRRSRAKPRKAKAKCPPKNHHQAGLKSQLRFIVAAAPANQRSALRCLLQFLLPALAANHRGNQVTRCLRRLNPAPAAPPTQQRFPLLRPKGHRQGHCLRHPTLSARGPSTRSMGWPAGIGGLSTNQSQGPALLQPLLLFSGNLQPLRDRNRIRCSKQRRHWGDPAVGPSAAAACAVDRSEVASNSGIACHCSNRSSA